MIQIIYGQLPGEKPVPLDIVETPLEASKVKEEYHGVFGHHIEFWRRPASKEEIRAAKAKAWANLLSVLQGPAQTLTSQLKTLGGQK